MTASQPNTRGVWSAWHGKQCWKQ